MSRNRATSPIMTTPMIMHDRRISLVPLRPTLRGVLFTALSLLASGCDRAASVPPKALDQPEKQSSTQPLKSAAATPAPVEEPALHKVDRKLMGTIWAVTIAGGDAERARAASDEALDEVARLETLLSEWKPDSEISRINDNAGLKPQPAGPELLACIRASQDVARWSDGAFDISWAALRGLWDFSEHSAHIPPSKAAVQAKLPLWNYRLIRVDEQAKTVRLDKKGMQIGLGGVAKGYALDRMGDILRARGFANFLVFAGGQILVGGKRGSRPWRVGIQHPREDNYFGFIEASDCSIATSGDYEHAYRYEGHTYHHIIDPKTGFPSERTASVTVIAPTALSADAVDTALFIMGPERALEALPQAPGGPIEAVLVGPDLKVHASPGAKPRVLLRYALDADQHLLAPLPRDAPNGTLN